MKINDLVIGAQRDPSFVVFRIVSITKNGWLRCTLYSEQNGKRLPANTIFRFRAPEMVRFNPSAN